MRGIVIGKNTLTPQEHADRINASWRATVDSVLKTAGYVLSANEDQETEDWLKTLARLEMGESTAKKLRLIALDDRIGRSHVNGTLPRSWGTLYELSTLTDGQWDYAEARALIRSDMMRKDVGAIKRLWNEENNNEVARAIVEAPLGQYETIVIDPPWQMEKISRDERPNQEGFDYPTMSATELALFPLKNIAADDCHLFLWATHKHLPLALRLAEVWGFEYVCTFVWHKSGGFQPIGLPQYNCEFALYCRRGAPKFLETKQFFTCFEALRREHSRKPDHFYDVVRRTCGGPRIDVFSREARDGFDQYGNEAQKFEAAA